MSQFGSPPKKIMRFAVEENEHNTTCRNCVILEKKVDEIKDTMQKQVETTQSQSKFIIESLSETKVILSKLLRQHLQNKPLQEKFPITTGRQLEEINKIIEPETRDVYIKTLKTLIYPSGILKGLKNILSGELTFEYNIDGIHGKKPLKTLTNFYSVLLDSIPTNSSGTAEAQLRKAIQLQKKRF